MKNLISKIGVFLYKLGISLVEKYAVPPSDYWSKAEWEVKILND